MCFCAFECHHGDRECGSCHTYHQRIRPHHVLYWRICNADCTIGNELSLESRRCHHTGHHGQCQWFLHGAGNQCIGLLGNFGAHRCYGQQFGGDANGNAFRSDDLLYRWQCHPDFQCGKRICLEPRRRHDAIHQRFDKWILFGPNHRCERLYRYVCTYSCDRESYPGSTQRYSGRSDDLLRWRKRRLDLQRCFGQYLVTRRCYDTGHYGDHKWFLHGDANGIGMYFAGICAYRRDGKSDPGNPDDFGIGTDDILRRRQRRVDQ